MNGPATLPPSDDAARAVVLFPALALKLIGALLSLLLLAGGAWMTTMYAAANEANKRTLQQEQKLQEREGDVRVLREKVERIEKDVGDIKQDGKELNRKLDQLLLRSR